MKHLFASTLVLTALLAPPAAAQTRRVVQNVQLWPELQAELALKNGDYLLLALHGERTAVQNYVDDGRFLSFDERRAGVSYEHFWGEHWSAGGTGYYATNGRDYRVVPVALLRHRSTLGPLAFGKRLSVERTFAGLVKASPGIVSPDDQNTLRLRLDLEKRLPLGTGSVALRPRLSYEAAAFLRLQGKSSPYEERSIEFTSLRGEVGCRVGEHFDFTPWVAYTTAYYFSLSQTGHNRLNQVTPVVGLDARLTLFAGKTVFERRQLPTQH